MDATNVSPFLRIFESGTMITESDDGMTTVGCRLSSVSSIQFIFMYSYAAIPYNSISPRIILETEKSSINLYEYK